MGIGAALQQIGGSVMNWGMQRKDAQAQQKQQQDEAAKQQKLLLERQAALQRLQVPPEKVVQLYDEQLKKAVNVRSQWQINEDGTSGSWVETGRDTVVPESKPAFQKFRQGDEEVSAFIDPATGTVQEVGRGNAFAPSQRRPAAAGVSNVTGGGSEGSGPAPSGAPRAPAGQTAPPRTAATRSTEEARALGQNAKNVIEKASGARETLAIIDQMDKLMQGGLSTGPMDQYLPGKDRQRFDVLQKQLVGPVIKSMFGSTQLSEGDRKAAEAALPGLGRYEDVNKDVLAQMRARAQAAIAEEEKLKGAQAAQAQPAGGYKIGDVIVEGGKQYRVVGGTPDDPEVEPL